VNPARIELWRAAKILSLLEKISAALTNGISGIYDKWLFSVSRESAISRWRGSKANSASTTENMTSSPCLRERVRGSILLILVELIDQSVPIQTSVGYSGALAACALDFPFLTNRNQVHVPSFPPPAVDFARFGNPAVFVRSH
jgi:hypothetical protein